MLQQYNMHDYQQIKKYLEEKERENDQGIHEFILLIETFTNNNKIPSFVLILWIIKNLFDHFLPPPFL